MLGKNAVAKATSEALSGSRQIEVEYEKTNKDGHSTATALAYLLALVFAKLISLPDTKERKLNKVFRALNWGDNDRTVVITFTSKFTVHNIDWFSKNLAKAIKRVEVVTQNRATAKRAKKGKK